MRCEFERKEPGKETKAERRRIWARAKNALLVASAAAMLAVVPQTALLAPGVRPAAETHQAGRTASVLLSESEMRAILGRMLNPAYEESNALEFDQMLMSGGRRTERLVERLRRSTVMIESDEARGSGVIIRNNGSISVILTNRHVVEGETDAAAAPNITVKNGDKTGRAFGVLLAPHELDLAIIVVNDDIGPPVRIARQRPAQGAGVLVLGAPLGLEDTLTMGVISNFQTRTTDSGFEYEAIQTDSAINPGNSGGGMFAERNGELLGIPSSKRLLNALVPAEGIAFAMPARLLYHIPLREWQALPLAPPQVAQAD